MRLLVFLCSLFIARAAMACDLALVLVPSGGTSLHFVCRPGLANCTQAKAILADLTEEMAKSAIT